MRKAQTGIGLVILGVVAIIAVIGLVLLFTRASKTEGALLTDLSIGNVYGGGTVPGQGISPYVSTPDYVPNVPPVAYPAPPSAYPGGSTYGTRNPSFIIMGYTSVEDLYGCERDLNMAGIPVPHNLFNCYALPVKGQTGQQVEGYYPPSSAAQKRPYYDTTGKIGGNMACYRNSVGAEQQVPNTEELTRELILTKLVDGNVGVEKYPWYATTVNGVRTPMCWVTQKTFIFDQGLPS